MRPLLRVADSPNPETARAIFLHSTPSLQHSITPTLYHSSTALCAPRDNKTTRQLAQSPMVSGQLSGSPASAFTLVELVLVIAVIIILAALLAPVFTNLKSAGDVTSAAYTIKGVLEQARNYAMANNTYVWVGFYEADASQPTTSPPTPGNGRLIISVVASIDGTNIYGSGSGTLDSTKLRQIGKLTKIESVHLPLFAICSGACLGDTFDTRPPVQYDPTAGYNYSRFGELNNATPNTAPYTTPYNFQYPAGSQPTFSKLLQFNPRGEARVNGDSYQIRHFVEIGLIQTHKNSVPNPTSGAGTSTAKYSGDVAALQITGVGGNTKIYRR